MADGGLRLLTVELAFGDDAFELPSDRDVVQLRAKDVMWQKERLQQIGAERLLDEGCREILFLDADIVFQDSGWLKRIRDRLAAVPIAQCFGTAHVHYSDQTLTVDSAVKQYLESGRLTGRVGYAWALRAELFERLGLYQHCVVGGGDSALFLGAIGLGDHDDAWDGRFEPHDFIKFAGPAMISHYGAWARSFYALSHGEVAFVDLTISTMPHGSYGDRNYLARHQLLKGFEPLKDVRRRDGEPFEWTPSGAVRAQAVLDYFHARNEDRKIQETDGPMPTAVRQPPGILAPSAGVAE